jgi:hypothetical protein
VFSKNGKIGQSAEPNLIVFHRPKSGNFCMVDGCLIVIFLEKTIAVHQILVHGDYKFWENKINH